MLRYVCPERMDSAIVSRLLQAAQEAEQQGYVIELCPTTQDGAEILSILGVDRLYPVVSSRRRDLDIADSGGHCEA